MVARNEARNLPWSLGSVREWASEIIVVVNDCTDGTEAIAESLGAQVIPHCWENYRAQKQFALSLAKQPWILLLDADEEVSAELRASIQAFIQGDPPEFAGAEINRATFLMGQLIRHGDWYPDRLVRLFRRGSGRMAGPPVHERVEVEGKLQRLSGDLLHRSFPDLEAFARKPGQFAAWHARTQPRARFSWIEAVLRPTWRFFRCYILKRGFLDGFPGLCVAWYSASGSFLKQAAIYHREPNPARPRPKETCQSEGNTKNQT